MSDSIQGWHRPDGTACYIEGCGDADHFSDPRDANWEGAPAAVNEHRTVGPHRARCFGGGCWWCYPHDWCDCCHVSAGHEKVWVDEEGDPVSEGAEG